MKLVMQRSECHCADQQQPPFWYEGQIARVIGCGGCGNCIRNQYQQRQLSFLVLVPKAALSEAYFMKKQI